MQTSDFLALSLLALGGEVSGKTKLQKTAYLLGALSGCLDELGYRPWYYGPYSDDVEAAVTSLKTYGAIDQNISSWGYDQSGFELRRYDFRLNDQGRKFAKVKAQQNPALWQRLQDAAKILANAGDIGYMDMSIAAKTYFLLGQRHSPATMDELAKLAPQFGWQVTPTQVQDAAKYLSRLGLVTLKPA